MAEVIMANPMGAIAQATQTAGAMDQLARMRQQDQYVAQDRGTDAQARKQKLLKEAMAFAGRSAPEILSASTPEEKNARYQQFRTLSGLQGFPVEMLPLEYSPEVERRLNIAAANAAPQGAKYGTSATYFKDPTTGKIVAAQGNQAGGFHSGGKAIPANWEPVAAPNTQFSQENQNYRMMMKPTIAGQQREAEAGVDIRTKPIIAADTRRAENTVDLVTKPLITAANTTAEQTSKDAVERKGAERSNAIAYGVYETGMSNLLKSLGDTTTGPIAGRLPAITASQQIAEGAQAAMAPVLKQMFRSTGEGTFTDKDQEMLLKMLPTRSDHPEAAKAKIQGIDAIVRAKLNQSAAPPPASKAAAMAPDDQAAVDWAKANPNDPRAAQIMQLHGGQ